jgi:HlyD family secretion protein
MQVRTLVDETDMGDIRAGMQASVTVEAYPDQTFLGIVEKIEPQAVVQQNVTMFPVIVELDNRSGLLRPGMNAEVVVELAQAIGVLLIPNSAVVTPQDVQPAAMVLGLDPEAIDTRALFGGAGRGGGGGGARRQGGGRGNGGPGAVEGGSDGSGARAPGGRPAGVEGEAQAEDAPAGRDFGAGRGAGNRPGGASFDSLRALIASGEISQDSARALFSGRGGRAGGGGFGGAGGFGRGAQTGQGEQDVADRQREARRAVVFVMAEDGTIEPRAVMIGLNDWDFTEVVSGLEEGELIAIVGAAQLRAQQDEFLNRIRSNSNPFGGGGPGGGRGFR